MTRKSLKKDWDIAETLFQAQTHLNNPLTLKLKNANSFPVFCYGYLLIASYFWEPNAKEKLWQVRKGNLLHFHCWNEWHTQQNLFWVVQN